MSNVAKTQKRIAEIYEKDGEYTLVCSRTTQATTAPACWRLWTLGSMRLCLTTANSSRYSVLQLDFGKRCWQIHAEQVDCSQCQGAVFQGHFAVFGQRWRHRRRAGHAAVLGQRPHLLPDQAAEICASGDHQRQRAGSSSFLQLVVIRHLRSFKFNEIIPFDKWKTTILTKIKSFIAEQGGAAPAKKTQQIEEEPELWCDLSGQWLFYSVEIIYIMAQRGTNTLFLTPDRRPIPDSSTKGFSTTADRTIFKKIPS